MILASPSVAYKESQSHFDHSEIAKRLAVETGEKLRSHDGIEV